MSETEYDVTNAEEPEAPNEDEDAEEAEGEDEQEPAATPEPEAPAALSQAEIEKRFKKIESAWRGYTTRVTTIMEDDATSLSECPLCTGTVPGFILTDGAGRVPEDVKKVVQTYLGVVQEADYAFGQGYEACANCQGLGKVRTRSQVPDYRLATCSSCSGRGFTGPGAQAAAVTAILSGQTIAPPDNGAQVPAADADPWGSPRLLASGLENPNFGRMPQYKSRELP